MLRHFPFTEKFDLKIGTSPLPDAAQLIELDEFYYEEIATKRKLLEEYPDYYFKAAPDTEWYQWEALSIVLHSLVKTDPQNFVLTKDKTNWNWSNELLKEKYSFQFGDTTTLPFAPLDWVGRQIQEDLLILNDKMILIAGSLCFPSGWDLEGKMNKHFFDIHGPLPSLTNTMIETANKFIERIPIGKTFQRNNWGFRVTDQLDLSARQTESYRTLLAKVSSEMTDENAGDQVFVRVEHQTMSRLPQSGYVLFTIHTYQNKLQDEIKDKSKAKTIYSFLQGVPEKLLEYKVMTPIAPILLSYLRKQID